MLRTITARANPPVTPTSEHGPESFAPAKLSREFGSAEFPLLSGAEAGPRQRPRTLAPGGALGGRSGGNRDFGRRRSLGAEDLLLAASLQQRLELLLLDRLVLDEDLGELLEGGLVLGENAARLHVRPLDDAA